MEKVINGIKYESISFNGDIIGWRLVSNWNNKNVHICIPDNIDGKPITVISAGAFGSCANLKDIEIPDSVDIINKDAFRICRKLETVTIYKSSLSSTREVLSIYSYAFEGCHKLKRVLCQKPCHLNGPGVFSDCFELCNVGNNNKIFGNIHANCFRNCVCLENLHIIGKNCRLWTDCFYGCSNLNTIRFDCELVYAPKTIINFLSKKHIICVTKCNLSELAYCGANIEII